MGGTSSVDTSWMTNPLRRYIERLIPEDESAPTREPLPVELCLAELRRIRRLIEAVVIVGLVAFIVIALTGF